MSTLKVGDIVIVDKVPSAHTKYRYKDITGEIVKIDKDGDAHLVINSLGGTQYFAPHWLSLLRPIDFESVTQKDVLIKCASMENFNQTLAYAEEAGYYLNSDFPVDYTNLTAIVSKYKPKTL